MTKQFENDLNELKDSALDFGASFLNVLGSGLDELFNMCENVAESFAEKLDCDESCDESCENYDTEDTYNDEYDSDETLPATAAWDDNDDLDPDVIPVGLSFNDELLTWNPDEDGNLFVVGQPGSGKTMLTLNFIEHAINHQWNVFNFDPKRDISQYYRDNSIINVSEIDEMLRAVVEIQKMINHNLIMIKTHKGIQLKKTLVVVSETWMLSDTGDSSILNKKKSLIKELLASIMKYGNQVGVYVVVSSQTVSAEISGLRNLVKTAVLLRMNPEEQHRLINEFGFESNYDMSTFSSGQGVMLRNYNECKPVVVFYSSVAK